MSAGAKQRWPKLRDELRLHPGPGSRFGAPTWTLHDPPGQRFFRLGWLEMEILRRWELGDPAKIAESIARETTITASPDAVMLVHGFLVANNLTVAVDREDTLALLKQKAGRKKSAASTLLHNYLFLRIPLLRPDHFLGATLGWVRWMFSRPFVFALSIAALCGLFLISREWTRFRDNLSAVFTLQGGLVVAAALGLSKVMHEFGHAYAAKRLGLRVPSMGVALMCFAPVLWTDTTEAWKLPSRRDRLVIGVSGVVAEFILATAASLFWPLLPEGGLKTAAFMLAGSIWILTLTVNINPCMRYDGYYLLSDFWNLPGLQTRSFALAKWWMREQLFDFGLSPPEAFSRGERTRLIAYAFCTWVYRFFLFMGIALLVYHLFFKALGLVLMTVELAFFIALPVIKEVSRWMGNVPGMRWNFRLVRTLLAFALAVLFFTVPWHGRVTGAAIALSERRGTLYAPAGAVIGTLTAANDLDVAEGDVLFRLRSPDLNSRIAIATHKVTMQRERLSFASLDLSLRVEMAAEWEQLEQLAEDLAGLLRERARLDLRAPFAGRLVDVPEWLHEGSWVQAREPLAVIAGGGGRVEVFVPEYARDRIIMGGEGIFFPAGKPGREIRLRIASIEEQSTRRIALPELASPYGGPLGAYKTADGEMEAEYSVYKVMCETEDDAPEQVLVGEASLQAKPRSLISEVWRRFLGLLVRESGV